MFRKVMFWVLAGALAIGTAAAPVLANTGYEGQPGNQSSGGGNGAKPQFFIYTRLTHCRYTYFPERGAAGYGRAAGGGKGGTG